MDDSGIKLRPAVRRFAEAMERILRENDYKGSVTNVRCDVAVELLWKEVRELDHAAVGHVNISTTIDEKAAIQKEAVDVANFALIQRTRRKLRPSGRSKPCQFTDVADFEYTS